jgi:predicted amidohydrolase
MQDLKIALIQSILHWEAVDANLKMFTDKIENISTSSDIIILPEMFTSGFTMHPERVAQGMNGIAVNWMLEMADKKNAVICGSLIISEHGKYYNRLIWAKPDGSLDFYDKRHLFSMAGEEKVYQPGHKKLIVEVKSWKICPMVCYDLRFPVWIRNSEQYDLLIFSANWPEKRISHWRKLLQARAIENQCFVAGVNCYGSDGNGVNYNGCSMVVDPMGEILSEIIDMDSIAVQNLQKEDITRIRRYMPFLKDMDPFTISNL